jgi:hypothetical protein
MAERLRIFVSATNDLEAERAIIGRAMASLPVQIGAEIRRTPATGAKYDDIYELIAIVDRFYFLMGQDITAPAGAEWHLAWELERSILPLRHGQRLTPAAQAFMSSTAPFRWQQFHNTTELSRIVSLDLVRILDHPTNRYGLTVSELELVRLHGKRTRATATPQRDPRSDQPPAIDPGGAEGGGVLLDIGHEEPIDGVALGDDE